MSVTLPFYRHPGLDRGSTIPASREWIPDQVRGDEGKKTSIAREVAQFSGLFA